MVKKILHYYRDSYTGIGESPAVFIIDNMAMIVFYHWYSCMDVVVVDKESFLNDPSLRFLYKDIPGSRNVCYTEYRYDDMVNFVGKRIKNHSREILGCPRNSSVFGRYTPQRRRLFQNHNGSNGKRQGILYLCGRSSF